VFVTPATLTTAEPGNDAVAESRVVWVDVDEPGNLARLRAFGHPPHLVVESGGSGGLHAYWLLERPVPGARAESANRRLAEALGGDRQSTNRARIMRLPGSRNRKRRPPGWCRVVMCDLARTRYDVGELCEGLEDPRERRPEPVRFRGGFEDPTRDVAPPAYFARLADIAVAERGGLVSCPHASHPDVHPSCMVYPEPGAGWHCFACGAGGGPIDLVSALAGGPTGRSLRGAEFKRAKCDCHARLGLGVEGDGGHARRPSNREVEEVRK
jgi:hypothetical protein